MAQSKFDVIVDGVHKTSLNPMFCSRQRIDDAGLEKLKALHVKRIRLEESFKVDGTGNMTGQEYAEAWENIEYELQETWGFPRDKDFHIFWRMKGCSCPKMDNNANYPYGPYSYSGDCAVHGYVKS